MEISKQLGRGDYSHKRSEGGNLQVETIRSALGFVVVVARTQKKNMEAGKEKKRKLAGWSTEMLEDEATIHVYEDTEEMMQRIIIGQEGLNELELFGTIGKEVMGN